MADRKYSKRGEARPVRYHVAFFQHAGGTINRTVVKQLEAKLDAKITTPPERSEICVWLESPGGDAHAAYKLFLDLRHRCSKLTAIVPEYAKSAATLLLLGVDTIYMGPTAELGPLDVQVEHPDREDEIVSGLDIADSLNFIGTTAVELIIRGGAALRAYSGLPRAEVMKDMCLFTAQFLQPLTAKLDPHLVHRAANQLKVAEHYAKRMLQRRKLDPKQQLSSLDADELMSRLISNYPTHAFLICRDEAKKLKLPVEHAEDHPCWPAAKFLHTSTATGRKNFAEVLTQPDVDRITTVLNNGKQERRKNASKSPTKVQKVASLARVAAPQQGGGQPKGGKAATGS
jgi:hypothetical protein